jgi:putative nucleotidyltransferase with HDIG domain
MENRAVLLSDASAERVMAELLFVLRSPGSSSFFRQMDLIGILEVVFPEIRAMKGCVQNGFHHKDVWEHSLLVMENCGKITNNPVEYFGDVGAEVQDNLAKNDRLELLKLAALLHDIGKPLTKGLNPDTGRITFYRHDEEGERIIDSMVRRLKMSARDRELLVLLTAEHLHILNLFKKGVKTSTKMRWFRKMRDDSIPAIVLGIADIMSSLGPESGEDYRTDLIARLKKGIHEYYDNIRPKIDAPDLINGRDLISFGMRPGPDMGRILELIRSAQDTGKISNREQGLDMAEKLIAEFQDGTGR